MTTTNALSHFYNKDGSLTKYAFYCGYRETKTVADVDVSLYYVGSVWNVRGFDNHTMRRAFWHTFRTLTEARKAYRRINAKNIDSVLPLNYE